MKIENQRQPDNPAETTPADTNPSNGKKFPVLPFACVLLALLLGVSAFRGVTGIRDLDAQLQDATATKEALESELEEVAAQEPAPEEPKSDDGDVKTRNLRLADEFLQQMLGWKSYEDYKNVRTWLFDNHTVDPNGSLDVFMPNVDEATLGDANLSCRGASVYVLDESGAGIDYLALCDVENKTNGNTGEGRVAVFYSIDAEGAISNISAYTLAR